MPTKPPRICASCKRNLTSDPYCPPCTKKKNNASTPGKRSEQSLKNKKFYNSKAWKIQKKEFLSTHPFCEWLMDDGKPCNKIAYIVDHRIARRLGGKDHAYNYQALCISHHGLKCAIENGRVSSDRAHPSNLK